MQLQTPSQACIDQRVNQKWYPQQQAVIPRYPILKYLKPKDHIKILCCNSFLFVIGESGGWPELQV